MRGHPQEKWMGSPHPQQQQQQRNQNGIQNKATNCSSEESLQVNQKSKRAPGHAFNLIAKQAEISNNMVTCIILVYHAPASIIMDLKVSHCFISSVVVTQYNISYENINVNWNKITRNGNIIIGRMCKLCPLVVCKRKCYANVLFTLMFLM